MLDKENSNHNKIKWWNSNKILKTCWKNWDLINNKTAVVIAIWIKIKKWKIIFNKKNKIPFK